jgi:hypothetical protein
MRPTAHRRVPITAMIIVIVRDTHISDKIANSQRIVPHIKEAIEPTEILLFCLALGVLFFSLINPHSFSGVPKHPLCLPIEVDILSAINEYIVCGICVNAEYLHSALRFGLRFAPFFVALHLLRGSTGISHVSSLYHLCALRALMRVSFDTFITNTP